MSGDHLHTSEWFKTVIRAMARETCGYLLDGHRHGDFDGAHSVLCVCPMRISDLERTLQWVAVLDNKRKKRKKRLLTEILGSQVAHREYGEGYKTSQLSVLLLVTCCSQVPIATSYMHICSNKKKEVRRDFRLAWSVLSPLFRGSGPWSRHCLSWLTGCGVGVFCPSCSTLLQLLLPSLDSKTIQ